MYINKIPNLEKSFRNLAIKSYIEKMLGKNEESHKTLNKALEKAKSHENNIKKVWLIYEDFYGCENKRHTEKRKLYGLD